MSDVFCHLRSSECGCEIHHCAAAPVEDLTYRPTIRDKLVVVAFGLFMFGFAWEALTQADEFYRKQQLDQQEIIAYGKR